MAPQESQPLGRTSESPVLPTDLILPGMTVLADAIV
jgi:hypothetical protein